MQVNTLSIIELPKTEYYIKLEFLCSCRTYTILMRLLGNKNLTKVVEDALKKPLTVLFNKKKLVLCWNFKHQNWTNNKH